jgi:hypothetical protein
METALMSESLVLASDVDETVTQVLTQLVQDGGEQGQMSVALLQEQVELHLGYSEGYLSKWHNRLGCRLRDFFKSKNPASVHTAPSRERKRKRLRARLIDEEEEEEDDDEEEEEEDDEEDEEEEDVEEEEEEEFGELRDPFDSSSSSSLSSSVVFHLHPSSIPTLFTPLLVVHVTFIGFVLVLCLTVTWFLFSTRSSSTRTGATCEGTWEHIRRYPSAMLSDEEAEEEGVGLR